MLAEPPLREVAEALSNDDPRGAASALQGVVDAEPRFRTPLVHLWAGLLWERASDPARALASCEGASAPSWTLSEYAELCAARARESLGRAEEALENLSSRAFTEPLESERLLLVSRLARASGAREKAIGALRRALGHELGTTLMARARLDLADLLVQGAVRDSTRVLEALRLIRQASPVLANSKPERLRAEALETRALAGLSPEQLALNALPSPEERLAKIEGLFQGREYLLSARQALELRSSLSGDELKGAVGCEALVFRAKALAALREYGSAVEALAEGRRDCSDDADRGARIYYLSGRYSVSEGRWVQAGSYFSELEKRYPNHYLTDDARYYQAIAQQELGIESRFTELMLTLPDDYPTGDMTAEGLFRLTLRRIERGAWSEALSLLERGIAHLGALDKDRGFDLAGRERYFKARALLSLGDRAGAVSQLAEVIREFPLSYYMVQAFSLLERIERGRGGAEVQKAIAAAQDQPFRVAGRAELEGPGFLRMMELLRIGELEPAVRELDRIGLRGEGTGSEILWGIALLYERAGFSKFSADLAKRQLGEVSSRWPVGGWERAWQIAFPRPHREIVTREAKTTGVDPSLIYAVMREESAFDPGAVSPANAYGLMQLIVPTAQMIGRSANLPSSPAALKRPSINVALGARMLQRLASNFAQNPLLSIPAYNAGPGRARRWIRERPSAEFDLWVELIPYPETRRYTKRVLSSRAVYAYLYEPEQARSRLVLPRFAGKLEGEAL